MKHFTIALILVLACFAYAIEEVIIDDFTIASVVPADTSEALPCMLIRFDLPGDLTSNGWVEIAKAYFPIVPFSDSHADDVPLTLKIFSLSGNWSRSTATWSEISTKIDTLYEYQPDNLINDSGYVEWDITDIVSNWASGTPNYGIIVIPGSSRDNFELEFGLRPFIMLNYIPDIRAIGE